MIPKRASAIFCVIALVAAAAAHAGEPGMSGFVFLRLGNGARAGGMGEAFTAVADDATAMYWNPGGLAGLEGVELNLSHTEWLMDIRFEQVSVTNEMFGGSGGLSFTGLYYGDIERRGYTPTVSPDGTYAPYDLSVSAGYGRDVLPNLAAGISAKLIHSKIDFESATSWAVDLGIVHTSMIEGLTLAASCLNLGPQAKFIEEKFYPPFELRGGAAYRYAADWLRGGILLAGDFVFLNDSEEPKLHLGMEYVYRDLVSVRGGWKANYYVQGPTLGLGVKYRSFTLDYAYMPMEFGLGDSQRLSLSVYSPSR